MKLRNKIIRIVVFIVVFAYAAAFLVSISSSFKMVFAAHQGIITLPTVGPPHQIEKINGLKVKWQKPTVRIFYHSDGPFSQTSNGLVFYYGSLENETRMRIYGLREEDGSVIFKTDPISDGGMEFVVDRNALYITDDNYQINKIELASQKKIWSQAPLNKLKPPSHLSLVNEEIQFYLHSNYFYVFSAEDGRILKEVPNVYNSMYRIEDGISYQRGGSNFLTALKEDGTTQWEVKLDEYNIAPVFTRDTIFIRTDRTGGSVYAVDRATGTVLWETGPDTLIISNVAASDNRVYYFTYDGKLLGVNAKTGEIEKSAEFSPQDFYPLTPKRPMFEVAYDPKTHMVFLILGNSAQMIAFEE